MIRVEPAPEPASFHARVRERGMIAIAEMVGEAVTAAHRGQKRRKIANTRADLRPEDFPPFWRDVSAELLFAYKRICAYSCLYIEPITGVASVDHWAPKSRTPDCVYEWKNYRLACQKMNARKKDFADVIDPFDVTEGDFAIDLLMMQVVPGPAAGERLDEVKSTIRRLGLDHAGFSEALSDYYQDYYDGHISLNRLERRAPFLARELRRQKRLLARDA